MEDKKEWSFICTNCASRNLVRFDPDLFPEDLEVEICYKCRKILANHHSRQKLLDEKLRGEVQYNLENN